MNYINNLNKDASIIVNQAGTDWLARVSQIANLNSQDIYKSISTVKTDLQLEFKDTLLGYVSQQQLDETVQDIKAKTDEQITVTLWHYCKKSDIDEIIELDYLVNYYTKEEIKVLFNSLKTNVNDSILNTYTKAEVNTLIESILTEVNSIKSDYSSLAILISKISESVEETLLSKYYTAEEIDNKLEQISENTVDTNYVTSALSEYMKTSVHNKEIQDVKSYTNEQISKTVAHYIKRNEVDTKLNLIKTTINNTLSIKLSSYYTKTEIDKKFEDIGKAYVQILTPREYQTLKLYGQIKDNNLYLISKYGRPIELYIGKLLFAKRSDDVAIGFPYTFPLVF